MKIYITEVENADYDEFLNKALTLVSQKRRDKADGFSNKDDKVTSAAAWLLLGFAIEEYLFGKNNISDDDEYRGVTLRPVSWRKLTSGYKDVPYTVEEGRYGKPEFAEEGAPYFSISHTGNITVVVISSRPTGIDIEAKRSFSEALKIRAFSDSDMEWINSAPDEDIRIHRTLRAWTLREAYIKMKGDTVFSDNIPTPLFENGVIAEKITDDYIVVEEKYDRYTITAICEK